MKLNTQNKWEIPDISDIRRALYFMIESHNGTYRKFSGEEYAHHPISVAKIVRNYKKSTNIEILIVAALLHDTVEDVEEVSIDKIRTIFGDEVALIVDELTSCSISIKEYGKAEYLMNKMINMSSYSLIIKLADRLHNCSDLKIANREFVEKYVKETRIIIDGLKDRHLTDTHMSLILAIDDMISEFEHLSI